MNRLWLGNDTTALMTSRSALKILRGQLLAIGVSAAILAAQYFLLPMSNPAVYMLCSLALLVCAMFGGWLSTATAAALTAAGGFLLESLAGVPLDERIFRATLYLLVGLAIAAAIRKLVANRQAIAQAMAAQSQREALLQASLEIVADGLVVVDDNGVIQSLSNAAERLFGWTAEEMLGRDFHRLLPPGEAADLSPAPPQAGEEASGAYRQVTGLKKDGSTFPLELRIAEVNTPAGRLLPMVVRDLTPNLEAERRLEGLRAQLTEVWSLNSMGEMASVLAHELNQPLSAVANYLRAARNLIARMELDDDDLVDAVTRAGDQAVRAGEIIRTMRDLATRGGTLQKPENLSTIIGELDFIISLMARDASARVFYDLYKGADTVMADRIQIQQLVVNLARNAFEAVTNYPNRQINISTRLDADGQLLTTIEDSGRGIDASVSDRLFHPLASTKPEGMGLGLSICSAIVENHRGRIWAEPSRLGGAAFCFVLARVGNDVDGNDGSDSLRRR